MSRILIANELGANYGHLARCLLIARSLRARGHATLFAARNVRSAAEVLGPARLPFVQAPLLRGPTKLARSPASYSEMLLGQGWGDLIGLQGSLRAWLTQFQLWRPDLVLADHAPTALLAARVVGVPHLAIGNGFAIPPDVSPLPSIRPWQDISVARLAHADRSVDTAIESAVKAIDGARATTLRELFAGRALLDTFAELDHFGPRAGVDYLGHIFGMLSAQRVTWQEAVGRKILLYLRPDVAGFPALMSALGEVDAEIVAVLPGLTGTQANRLATPRLRIHTAPVALDGLLATADLVVNYGSTGVMAETLLTGTPMLLVPRYVEQYLAARRAEATGAVIVIGEARRRADFMAGLTKILDGSCYRASAGRFADKYAGFTPQQAIDRAVVAIEAAARRPISRQPLNA